MTPLAAADIRALAARMLAEDRADEDVTTLALVPTDARMSGTFAARESLIVAGLDIAAAIFAQLDADVSFSPRVSDGTRVAPGEIIAGIAGQARPILTGERSALNMLQHLSGIATLTRRYVDAVEGTGAIILDTRKTVPGLRHAAKYATSLGGAKNHRMDLAGAILIKDNHIALSGSLEAAVGAARENADIPIEVECDTLAQVADALALGADHLLLDNMTPEDLRAAVAEARGRATLEASGGVTLETVRGIAETGVDYISVGRITQSAPAVDIGLDFVAHPEADRR